MKNGGEKRCFKKILSIVLIFSIVFTMFLSGKEDRVSAACGHGNWSYVTGFLEFDRTCNYCGHTQHAWYVSGEGATVTVSPYYERNVFGSGYQYWIPANTTVTMTSVVKTGYHTAGWRDADENGTYTYSYTNPLVFNIGNTAGDKTAWATPNTYTVKYNGNGATGGSTASSSHTYDTAKALTANGFTKTGYSFAGWATSSSGAVAYSNQQSVSNLTTTNGGTVNLYAKWTANNYKYNIKYVSNSGKSLGSTTITKAFNTTNTVNPVAKTGYTSPASQSVKWDSTSAKTITFTYTPITYNITYVLNEGTNPSTGVTTSYNIESSNITLPTPTREGYTFGGWYTSSDLSGSAVSNIATGSYGDKTYYAKWIPNIYGYNVEYNSSSGLQLGGEVVEHEFDTTNVVNPKPYDGYVLPESQTVVWDSVTPKLITFLYNLIDYNISYELNGGNNPEAGVAQTYNIETDTFELPTPSRDGYTFDGWYSDNAFSGNSIASVEKGSFGDKVYYAKWTPNTYKVTFEANGGTSPIHEKEIVFDFVYGDLPTPSRSGYTFIGWYDSNTEGVQVTKDTLVNKSYNHTLYAMWQVNTYEVIFDANTGTTDIMSKTVTYGDMYGELPVPTKTGYEFTGWYTELTGGKEITANDVVKITSSQRLYAHWVFIPVTLSVPKTCVLNSHGKGSMRLTAPNLLTGRIDIVISSLSLTSYGKESIPVDITVSNDSLSPEQNTSILSFNTELTAGSWFGNFNIGLDYVIED